MANVDFKRPNRLAILKNSYFWAGLILFNVKVMEITILCYCYWICIFSIDDARIV